MAESEEKELIIEDIVRDYLGLVYSFIFRLTGAGEETSDITQEVFVKAWKNLDKYNPKQNFKTWLLAIARNTAIDWLRKKRPIVFSKLDREGEEGERQDFVDTLVDAEVLQDELFAQKELKEELDKLIDILPLLKREVLLLRLEDELTFEEISKLVGRPLNTVKSQYRRALMQLKSLHPRIQ